MAEGRIVRLLIEEEMKDSYLTYALSVIKSRALPDARDGLKPSQRRILLAMHDLNLSPQAKFRKCAKIAGDTSGNYHPHGESVVYPTLVRMAQDWVLRYPLVHGQGNFGNLDGDSPAAMRYTECKLRPIAMELLEDIEEDTVDLVRNYDDTRDEATVLPGKFPNLLCNGSAGIAVGMATSIPPHNLREVCDALVTLIDDPQATVGRLMQHVQGPDFPTGAEICGRAGIHEAYHTGKGRIQVRAVTHVEELARGREAIVVDAIPYQLNKTSLIEEMAGLVNRGKLTGISDIRDESGRKEAVRIVIELKRGENTEVILNNLFKHTPLQSTYSIILMAVVGERPLTLTLKELLQAYLDHRLIVIRRRTAFRLARARERAHIVEGLRKALDRIDEVIRTIRASQSVPEARDALVERFEFTVAQAEAILRMTLARLTGLERQKLDDELAELRARIADYEEILAQRARVQQMIKDDLAYLRGKYGDDRRTRIGGEAADLEHEDLIADEQVVVTMTHEGYIKRNAIDTYRQQRRGGKGIAGAGMKEGDFVETLFIAGTHQYILFFTNTGKLHWLKVYHVPEAQRTAKGRSVVNLITLEEQERITSVIPVSQFDERYLIMATSRGLIKKTVLSAYGNPRSAGIRAIDLNEGDQLIRVQICTDEDQIMLGTATGRAIRFKGADARPMGRVARGVIGIKLASGNQVVDMVVVDPEASLLTVTENGYGKRTGFEHYPTKHRGGRGVIDLKTTAKTGRVVALMAVRASDELMMISAEGQVVRTTVSSIRTTGRASQGVRVIGLNEGDKLVSAARLAEAGDV